MGKKTHCRPLRIRGCCAIVKGGCIVLGVPSIIAIGRLKSARIKVTKSNPRPDRYLHREGFHLFSFPFLFKIRLFFIPTSTSVGILAK